LGHRPQNPASKSSGRYKTVFIDLEPKNSDSVSEIFMIIAR